MHFGLSSPTVAESPISSLNVSHAHAFSTKTFDTSGHQAFIHMQLLPSTSNNESTNCSQPVQLTLPTAHIYPPSSSVLISTATRSMDHNNNHQSTTTITTPIIREMQIDEKQNETATIKTSTCQINTSNFSSFISVMFSSTRNEDFDEKSNSSSATTDNTTSSFSNIDNIDFNKFVNIDGDSTTEFNDNDTIIVVFSGVDNQHNDSTAEKTQTPRRVKYLLSAFLVNIHSLFIFSEQTNSIEPPTKIAHYEQFDLPLATKNPSKVRHRPLSKFSTENTTPINNSSLNVEINGLAKKRTTTETSNLISRKRKANTKSHLNSIPNENVEQETSPESNSFSSTQDQIEQINDELMKRLSQGETRKEINESLMKSNVRLFSSARFCLFRQTSEYSLDCDENTNEVHESTRLTVLLETENQSLRKIF